MSDTLIKPGRPRASEVDARMQNLIDTAGALFLRKGFRKVSLEAIAREARVAIRTIYVKFGGKAGLFKAVIMRRREEFFATTEDMEQSGVNVRDFLIDFAQRYRQLASQPDAAALYKVVIAEAHHEPELAEAFFDAGPRQTRETLARFFSRFDVQAQLHIDAPVDDLPAHFLNCVMGDYVKSLLLESRWLSAEADLMPAEVGVDLFLRGVLR